MYNMGVITGPSSHWWAKEVDKNPKNWAERRTWLESKEGRINRKQEQDHVLDTQDDDSIIYRLGIDGSM